jgi:Tol biopolymer transport system component
MMKRRWHVLIMGLLVMLPFLQLQAREAATTYIAYVSSANGSEEIFVTDLARSVVYNLTNARSRDWHPSWSPDGSRIAFNSDRANNTEIYVMNANGSNPVNVSNNPGSDGSPAWSPVADDIAFISDRDGGYDLYMLDLTGGSARRLTEDGVAKSDPAWSPDGRKIVYWQQVSANSTELRVIDIGSGEITILRAEGQSLWPAWSPDGSPIAFHSQEKGQADIYTLADSVVTNLTNTPAANEARPDWSPDGSQIVYMSDQDGNFNLYIMNADGSAPRQLTNSPQDDHSPAWQPRPAVIDFSNTAFGQNMDIVRGPIDPEAQKNYGFERPPQVRFPPRVNLNTPFRVRFEIEVAAPSGEATPMPTPDIPVGVTGAAIPVYRFMGARLAGIDIDRFEIDPDLDNYVMLVNEEGVNYLEWWLKAKDASALGTNYLAVIPYLPEVQAEGAMVRKEFDPLVFSIEVLSGEPDVPSELIVDRSNPSPPKGFSVVFSGDSALSLIFSQDMDLSEMQIRSDGNDQPVVDDFTSIKDQGNRISAGSCLYYIHYSAESPSLPAECNRAGGSAYDRPLLSTDLFWMDRTNHRRRDVVIVYGDDSFLCKANVERCDF